MTNGDTPQTVPESAARCTRGRALAVFTAIVLLALLAVFNQVKARGLAWQEQHYAPVLQNTFDRAPSGPALLYPLSAWVLVPVWRAFEALGVPRPCGVALVAVQLTLVIATFLIALAYYRRLGIPIYAGLLGVSALAWGMTFWSHQTSLGIDTHLELIFYLLAMTALLRGHILWAAPITLFATLNCGTSVAIPFLVLAFNTKKGYDPAWLPLALYLVVSGALFFFHPESAAGSSEASGTSFLNLAAVLGIMPLLTFATPPLRWPQSLQALAKIFLPLWIIIHLCLGNLFATATLLLPQALFFIPCALLLLAPGAAIPEDAAHE